MPCARLSGHRAGLGGAEAWGEGTKIRFLHADAEHTLLPAASHQVIVTRHLAWTQVDPAATLAERARVLVPGGQIPLVDGRGRLSRLLRRLIGQASPRHGRPSRRYPVASASLKRYPRRGSCRPVGGRGLCDIRIDRRTGTIHRAQAGSSTGKSADAAANTACDQRAKTLNGPPIPHAVSVAGYPPRRTEWAVPIVRRAAFPIRAGQLRATHAAFPTFRRWQFQHWLPPPMRPLTTDYANAPRRTPPMQETSWTVPPISA